MTAHHHSRLLDNPLKAPCYETHKDAPSKLMRDPIKLLNPHRASLQVLNISNPRSHWYSWTYQAPLPLPYDSPWWNITTLLMLILIFIIHIHIKIHINILILIIGLFISNRMRSKSRGFAECSQGPGPRQGEVRPTFQQEPLQIHEGLSALGVLGLESSVKV